MTPRDGADRLRVLHLIHVLRSTNSQYNEHSLPVMDDREISLCTYFAPQLEPPPQIRVFAGDDTLRGFFRALRSALAAGEYDVIHAHSPQTGLFLLMAILGWGRFELRRRSVYTVHDSFYDYKLRNQALMVLPLAAVSRVVFCSRAAYDSLPSVLQRLVGRRSRIVPNGVDIARIDRVIASLPVRRRGPFTALSIGRLEAVKDPLAVLAAFERGCSEDARLVFVGDGPLRDRLREEVARRGLAPRVTLTGLIERDEVFRRLVESDVYVSPSHGEGLPVAVMEAMACSLPVILSDIPPHREFGADRDVIPLVAPGDVDGLARELGRLEEMPRHDRANLGRAGRELVTSGFSLERMSAAYEAVYREHSRSERPTVPVSSAPIGAGETLEASPDRLAVFLPSLAGGGAERVSVNLAIEAARRGLPVDLVLSRVAGPYLSDVPPDVRIVDLAAPRVLLSTPALVRYLRRVRPGVMLTALSHANVIGLWARRIARVPTRVVVAEHDTLSSVTRETRRRRARLMPQLAARTYPMADAIVAVSAGVADDLAEVTGMPRSDIDVVYNPVVTPEVAAAAQQPVPHPWLEAGEPPVVLGVGRLAPKKDFASLLRAFAKARVEITARLLILGDGPLREELAQLVESLDLSDDVSIEGFVDNPYAYMSRAALFVLSSRWEGLPTVLIEAMFCGVPVVATDCPSGPREILGGGRYGRLVPVGQVDDLANAIVAGVRGEIPPPPPESWQPFQRDVVVDRYLEIAYPAER